MYNVQCTVYRQLRDNNTTPVNPGFIYSDTCSRLCVPGLQSNWTTCVCEIVNHRLLSGAGGGGVIVVLPSSRGNKSVQDHHSYSDNSYIDV